MTARAYYNEIDPYAAQWLRNLIAAGHIAAGDVDERSIKDVRPSDLIGYSQCHFFAGIGVWSYALRQAGWSDEREVWTGSCPCQPFSAAGQRKGFADERHLWPAFAGLVRERAPRVVFGEQVAAKDGYAWLDVVQADLEEMGYACGPVVLPAAGFGAPHGRHRIFFVAESEGTRPSPEPQGRVHGELQNRFMERGEAGELADTQHAEWRPEHQEHGDAHRRDGLGGRGNSCVLADTGREGRRQVGAHPAGGGSGSGTPGLEQRPEHGGPVNGFWRDAEWLPCIDGKARPVEPGTFPLAHGAPARVGRLRAYGNCIAAPQAAEFVKAYLACRS